MSNWLMRRACFRGNKTNVAAALDTSSLREKGVHIRYPLTQNVTVRTRVYRSPWDDETLPSSDIKYYRRSLYLQRCEETSPDAVVHQSRNYSLSSRFFLSSPRLSSPPSARRQRPPTGCIQFRSGRDIQSHPVLYPRPPSFVVGIWENSHSVFMEGCV